MKSFKHILLSCLLIFTMQQAMAYGDYSYGDEVVLKSDKVFVKFGMFDDQDKNHLPVYLFTVILRSSKKHLTYPWDSKLVIQFSNDSIIELNSFGPVINEIETTDGVGRSDDDFHFTWRVYNPYYEKYGIYNNKPPIEIYYTGRNYRLEDTDLQKLLMWRIVKVQVELSDGKWKDFKVGKKQGNKVLNQLQDSWRSLE